MVARAEGNPSKCAASRSMYKANVKYSNHATKGADDGGGDTPDKAMHTAMMRSSDAVLVVGDHRKNGNGTDLNFAGYKFEKLIR